MLGFEPATGRFDTSAAETILAYPEAQSLGVIGPESAHISACAMRRSSQAGRALHADAYYTLTRFVRSDPLALTTLARLTEADLRAWQLRVHRRRASSIQRMVNDLKATLNGAFVLHRKVLPADLPVTIKFGLKVEAPEMLPAAVRSNRP